MRTTYISELEGMVDFYNELQITPSYDLNTDGVIQGNLIEFKKTPSIDGGVIHHKEQIKRYLKAYNSAAKDIPSISWLIYLNTQEFIKIDNSTGKELQKGKWRNPIEFKDKFLANNQFIKGYIDEYSIVAYNNRYCYGKNKISKEEIKKEFLTPKELKIEPFDWNKQIQVEEKNKNEIGWLHFNMNLLGDELLKKQLGAFFTPEEYVNISTRYIRNALIEINDRPYLIIDRCAGTGNLEKFLSEEELKHCVLNTIDYTEWTTLKGLYDGRVKLIVPPTHKHRDERGLLKNGDALSEEFNLFFEKYISDWRNHNKNGILIFIENPPFAADAGFLPNSGLIKKEKKTSYIEKIMKKEKVKNYDYLQNRFIWSAFNMYMKNDDHYILFSPIKYWKLHHLIDKEFIEGYLTNKGDYNTGSAGLPVIHWKGKDKNNDSLNFENDFGPFNGKIKKINNPIQKIYLEDSKSKIKDIICYHKCSSTDIMYGNINCQIFNNNTHGGIKITSKNILQTCPLFCAGKFDRAHTIQWYEADVIMKSSDSNLSYMKDRDFIKKCFLWTCLNIQNRCFSNNKIQNQMALLQKSKCDYLLEKMKLIKNY